jgi:DnaJ like chaperone protein
MRRLELQADAQRAAIDAFARGKAGQDDLRRPLRRLRHQPDQARQLLQACVRMAQADRRLGGAEQRLLETWRDWLGVPRSELDGLLASSRRGAPAAAVRSAYEQALQLLGVDSQADASEIKRAYRRQLSRCHPDKLTGSGATPAQIRAATEKTRELHAAYALLRQRQR